MHLKRLYIFQFLLWGIFLLWWSLHSTSVSTTQLSSLTGRIPRSISATETWWFHDLFMVEHGAQLWSCQLSRYFKIRKQILSGGVNTKLRTKRSSGFSGTKSGAGSGSLWEVNSKIKQLWSYSSRAQIWPQGACKLQRKVNVGGWVFGGGGMRAKSATLVGVTWGHF